MKFVRFVRKHITYCDDAWLRLTGHYAGCLMANGILEVFPTRTSSTENFDILLIATKNILSICWKTYAHCCFQLVCIVVSSVSTPQISGKGVPQMNRTFMTTWQPTKTKKYIIFLLNHRTLQYCLTRSGSHVQIIHLPLSERPLANIHGSHLKMVKLHTINSSGIEEYFLAF